MNPRLDYIRRIEAESPDLAAALWAAEGEYEEIGVLVEFLWESGACFRFCACDNKSKSLQDYLADEALNAMVLMYLTHRTSSLPENLHKSTLGT